MKALLLTIAVLGLGFASVPSNADCGSCEAGKSCDHANKKEAHKHSASATQTSTGQLVVNINGMSCEHCASKISKGFTSLNDVKTANVDLKKKQVAITLKDGKTLDETTISKVINTAGFEFKGIQTTN